MDLDRGGQALLYGPDRRPSAGIRAARQGRDHPAPGDDASGRVSVGRRDPRDLDRPCPDAGRGVRLFARLDAGDAAAIPPARGASDPGDGDRGGDRPGLPRRDPRAGIGASRVWPATCSSVCRRPRRGAAPTPMGPRRATTRPNSRPRGCRAAAAMRRRAAWRRSTRCCSAGAGSARCGCCRRGSSLMSKKPHRRARRRRDGRHPDASRAGTPCPRRERPHPRARHDRRAQTFGHGGAGTSYSWADPTSGVSFTYVTNFVQPDPWHSARLDRVANLVHAAID